jgi:hypothetical protein
LTLEQALRNSIDGEVRFDRLSRALYSTDASVYQIEPAGVVNTAPRSRRVAAAHHKPGRPSALASCSTRRST